MSEKKASDATGADSTKRIAVFQEKTVRRTWHDGQWWFAIVDVVAVLTDSKQPDGYLKDLRRRDKELAKGWGQIATPLRISTEGGVQRLNCGNTEGLLRMIQSIPSPKAEPFKRWLAQVGYERIQEIENPELASARARELYEASLVKAPRECIDYVLIHELCHLKEHNHGPRFHRTLDRQMPGWRQVKERLDGWVEQFMPG